MQDWMILSAVAGLAAAVVVFGLGYALGRRSATAPQDAAAKAAEAARTELLRAHGTHATRTLVSVWRRFLATNPPGEDVRDVSDLPYTKRRIEDACLLALASTTEPAERAGLAQAVRALAQYQTVGARRRYGAMQALNGNAALAVVANDTAAGPGVSTDEALAATVQADLDRLNARLAPLLADMAA